MQFGPIDATIITNKCAGGFIACMQCQCTEYLKSYRQQSMDRRDEMRMRSRQSKAKELRLQNLKIANLPSNSANVDGKRDVVEESVVTESDLKKVVTVSMTRHDSSQNVSTKSPSGSLPANVLQLNDVPSIESVTVSPHNSPAMILEDTVIVIDVAMNP